MYSNLKVMVAWLGIALYITGKIYEHKIQHGNIKERNGTGWLKMMIERRGEGVS